MATDLLQLVQTEKFLSEEIAARTHEIYETILRAMDLLGGGSFTVVPPNDVEWLFDLYDVLFFDGGYRNLLLDTPVYSRLSKPMTKAGGKAGRRELRNQIGKVVGREFEIAVSTTLPCA